MKVRIIQSARRKSTVEAKVIDGVMEVYAPHDISKERLDKIIEGFKKRFEKRKRRRELNRGSDLRNRAEYLNQRYFDGKINFVSIEYSTEQDSIFGSCSPHNGSIRLSHRIAEMPRWVKDYLVIHELAHLKESSHNKRFWKLVNRYPLTERARGFLIAKGIEENS